MYGYEILEEASAGNHIMWTRNYALKQIRSHSACPGAFEREANPQWTTDGRIRASVVLEWLGY
jgi:hypothetical protein